MTSSTKKKDNGEEVEKANGTELKQGVPRKASKKAAKKASKKSPPKKKVVEVIKEKQDENAEVKEVDYKEVYADRMVMAKTILKTCFGKKVKVTIDKDDPWKMEFSFAKVITTHALQELAKVRKPRIRYQFQIIPSEKSFHLRYRIKGQLTSFDYHTKDASVKTIEILTREVAYEISSQVKTRILNFYKRLEDRFVNQLEGLHQNGNLEGVWSSLEEELYHRIPGLSNSNMGEVEECFAQYLWRKKNPMKRSDAMDAGSAFHMMVLERERFDRLVVEGRSFSTKNEDRMLKNAFELENVGKLIIAPEAMRRLEAGYKNLMAHPLASKLVQMSTRNEVSIIWKRVGFDCHGRARIDIYIDKVEDDEVVEMIKEYFPTFKKGDPLAADLKFYRSANLDFLSREMFDKAWYRQGSYYLKAGQACLNPDLQAFLYIVVENTGLQDVVVFPLQECDRQLGEHSISKITNRYIYHRDNEASYKGRSKGLANVSLPHWAINRLTTN